MNLTASVDPFAVLGLPRDAGEGEVRARYLELVKRFPPERDPDKFREVRAAYEAAKDPLSIARRLIAPPGDQVPKWSALFEAQKRTPPRLTPAFVLSLGNRAADDSAASVNVNPGSVEVSLQADSPRDNIPTSSSEAIDAP